MPKRTFKPQLLHSPYAAPWTACSVCPIPTRSPAIPVRPNTIPRWCVELLLMLRISQRENFAGHRMSTEAMATRSNAPFQKIAYLYRDAGNYKFWGEFCVAGTLTLDDLIPHLFESEYFVPKIVGIPSLVPACKNDDDHDFHEIVSITPTARAHCAFTACELIERFRAANERNWF